MLQARVLVGQGIARGVLLPQQHQGDAGSLEFLVHEPEVGGALVAAAWQRRAVQPGLVVLVAKGLGDVSQSTPATRASETYLPTALLEIFSARPTSL